MTGITVNGIPASSRRRRGHALLWYPRDELGLTGTRFGCGAGLCGCCTVHVDGKAISSCLKRATNLSCELLRAVLVPAQEKISTERKNFRPSPYLISYRCNLCVALCATSSPYSEESHGDHNRSQWNLPTNRY
jgi:hypothetical protein